MLNGSSTSIWLLLTLTVTLQVIVGEEQWRFINLADFHGGEAFVGKPVTNQWQFDNMNDTPRQKFEAIQAIYQDYGGELVLIPGDTNGGHWYKEKYLRQLNVANSQQAVLKAGRLCYDSLKFLFQKAGYDKLLVAVGDHELGGNAWNVGDLKTKLLPYFRRAFTDGLNRGTKGGFLYQKPVGTANSRPIGTPYATTSYAHQHKNVMFITVDAFHRKSADFINKQYGLGGEGSVTCTVMGDHLKWFIQVLKQSRKDSSIDHIIVQAHLPILQPVRKAYCSGQFMDRAENSLFWKAMREHDVDVYFAGEVHANTATKDDKSNLVQVVSRGNGASNFLTVDVTDTALLITSYKEVGWKEKFNGKYVEQGRLVIDKSARSNTMINGTGNLELFDRYHALIHLTFDEIGPISERPLTVLKHDQSKTRIQTKVTIRGTECRQSFINYGTYGQDYDALAGKVKLSDDSIKGKSVVLDSWASRIAIDGLGPHGGGHPVSYALWFKTKMKNVHLIHYGKLWGGGKGGGKGDDKNFIFSLTLDNGRPAVHASETTRLVVQNTDMDLSNNVWHHVAISMPRKSCRLSEVNIWVDGRLINWTQVMGNDHNLFFFTAGRISVGSLGRSGKGLEALLPNTNNFQGNIDEVYVWARPIWQYQIDSLMSERE